MWSLDDVAIGLINTTSINITFSKQHIGNRTLKYTAYTGEKRVVLATLSIIISTNRKYGKNALYLIKNEENLSFIMFTFSMQWHNQNN